MAQGGSHPGRPAGPLTGVVRLSGRHTCSLVALGAPRVHQSNRPLPAITQGGDTASLASMPLGSPSPPAAPPTPPRASQGSLGAMGASAGCPGALGPPSVIVSGRTGAAG